MAASHPLPAGTRVHHGGCLWSRGWATVIDVDRREDGEPRRYSDGSYEYEVRYDRPMFASLPPTGWWASYDIDATDSPPDAEAVLRAAGGSHEV